ncbi:unnamed protein product [Discosporangium mesarthrocarpum]
MVSANSIPPSCLDGIPLPDGPCALAVGRPEGLHPFHHQHLGIAHLRRAQELSQKIDYVREDGHEGKDGGSSCPGGGSRTQTRISEGHRESDFIWWREARAHHLRVANDAFWKADQLQQLNRSPATPAGVWLGQATTHLEKVVSQVKGHSRIRSLLARARNELGQFERSISECRVASRLLEKEDQYLRQAEEEKARIEDELRRVQKEAEAKSRAKAAEEERARAREKAVAQSAAASSGGGEVAGLGEQASFEKQGINYSFQEGDAGKALGTGGGATADQEGKKSEEQVGAHEAPPGSTVVQANEPKKGLGESQDGVQLPTEPSLGKREKIELLKMGVKKIEEDAREGWLYVQQSVDVADISRGFEITRHGIPVRTRSRDTELLREGQSQLQDRYKHLMCRERKKQAARAKSLAKLDKTRTMAAKMKADCRRAMQRVEAALAVFREEEERQDREEQEMSPAILDKAPLMDVSSDMQNDDPSLRKEGLDGVLWGKTAARVGEENKNKTSQYSKKGTAAVAGVAEEVDEEEEELQRLLAGRARKTVGKRGKKGRALKGRRK